MRLLRHPDEWNRGVIGMSVDDAKEGLLFCMDKEAPWPVAMNGVSFPIDVYWLSDGGMVTEHAELFPGMPVFWPEANAKYVLELPMPSNGPCYKVGDFVEFPHE